MKETMLVLILAFTIFGKAGAVPACSCTSQTEVEQNTGKTIGNCLSSFGGKKWCYISSSSSCPDKKQSSRNQLYWSAQACRNKGGQEPAEPGNVQPVKDDEKIRSIRCKQMETEPYPLTKLDDLKNFNFRCGRGRYAGYALNGFYLANYGSKYVYHYTCCSLPKVNMFPPTNTSGTVFQLGTQKLNALTKQDVNCGLGTVMYSFQMMTTRSDLFYNYGCSTTIGNPQCIHNQTSTFSTNVINLANIVVRCPNELFDRYPYLQQFQLVFPNPSVDTIIQYNYTCCTN